MTPDQGDPYSARWRIASVISPELVALVLIIALALLVLLIIGIGSPGGVDIGHSSAAPSTGLPSSSN